jgi:hypothetical protein
MTVAPETPRPVDWLVTFPVTAAANAAPTNQQPQRTRKREVCVANSLVMMSIHSWVITNATEYVVQLSATHMIPISIEDARGCGAGAGTGAITIALR